MQSIRAVVEARPRTQKRDRDVTVPAILAAAEIEFATMVLPQRARRVLRRGQMY
jgi:hypothetical protein